MHHRYQNHAVTDGFTASGFMAPKARNLSRFESQKLKNQDGDRRFGLNKRRSEQVRSLGDAGAQAIQGIGSGQVARKPFDIEAEDFDVPMIMSKQKRGDRNQTLETGMLI